MFSTEELESLDRSYFSVICADAYDVTIMSKNTGHHSRITGTVRRGVCGRRSRAFRSMIPSR